MSEPPRFEHPCARCTFLGRWEDFDLYHCVQHELLPTVIARYGNDGSAYSSSLAIAATYVVFERGRDGQFQLHPEPIGSAMAAAFDRARERGLPLAEAPSSGPPAGPRCASCGGPNVSTRMVAERIPYGAAPDVTELACELPWRDCADCGFEFRDEEGEAILERTVLRHVLRTSPTLPLRHQIVALSDATETTVTITGRCSLTGQPVVIRDVPLDGLLAWQAGAGDFIQNCLRSLSDQAREFLITGLGPDAQAALESIVREGEG